MSLALDRDRVRSSVVLDGTCRSSPKSFESLATDLSGEWPASATRIEGRSPKLGRRMPLATQRRNHAYLNPLIERPAASTGLAIDLDGSLERRFRPEALGDELRAPPLSSGAAAPKGLNSRRAQDLKRRFVTSNG